jgi:phage tail-like protein
MTDLLRYSKSILTERIPNDGLLSIGSGDWLFSLGANDNTKFTYSQNTFVVDSITYTDHLGWKIGDYHQVSQNIDLSGMSWVWAEGKCQAPDGSPVGTRWKFSIIINGFEKAYRYLDERILDLSDVKAPVVNFTTSYDVIFRLELVAVAVIGTDSVTEWRSPWVHIDDVAIEIITDAKAISRIPAPNELSAPVDPSKYLEGGVIQFDLYDPNKVGFDWSTADIKINGVQAFLNSSTILAPFNGGISGVITFISWWERIVLDTTNALPSLSEVEVDISINYNTSETLTETYTFTLEDKSKPRLESIETITRKSIRVQFSQNVQSTDAVSATLDFPWGTENLTVEDNTWKYDHVSYPWSVSWLSEPFSVVGGTTIILKINGGDEITVQHPATVSTAVDVASGLDSVLSSHGGRAVAHLGKVYIASADPLGTIQIIGGTSNAILGFDSILREARLAYGTPEGIYTLISHAVYPDGFISNRSFDKLLTNQTYDLELQDNNEVFNSSVLNPDNYAITVDTELAQSEVRATYPPSILSVKAISNNIYELTLGQDMTPDGAYILTVSGITDFVGNIIDPNFSELNFRGYVQIINGDRYLDFYKMFADFNRQQDTDKFDLKNFSSAISEVMTQLMYDLDDYTANMEVDKSPEWMIEAYLIHYGNPFVYIDLPLSKKRQLINILAELYKRKGSEDGIDAALKFLFGYTSITFIYYWGSGWSLGLGELGIDTVLEDGSKYLKFSFGLEFIEEPSDERKEEIRKVVDAMKPAHIRLLEIKGIDIPFVADHWQIPFSGLGDTTILHS